MPVGLTTFVAVGHRKGLGVCSVRASKDVAGGAVGGLK